MSNVGNTSSKTVTMVQTALLAAIIVAISFTPLGYGIKIGTLSVTFMVLPVAIGASISGAWMGLILGTVFGITSFINCITGGSVIGTIALSINPFFCFLMCVASRAITGAAAGFVSTLLNKLKVKSVKYAIIGITASLLNSILFLGSMYLFFADKMMKNSDFLKMMEENDAAGISFFAFVIAPAFINIIAEAFFNTFLNAVIMTALVKGRVIKNNTAAIN